ncbi:hypothetical protein [Nocardia sp. SYP-A9097]|uniref:hypothetical protein n=1 Tax=Nocardia sp. SYP-A9097 TaxID=2663237 RepID=UPI00129A116A|nr:hypothetical protein [Nocardia sp. SYP-A9097]
MGYLQQEQNPGRDDGPLGFRHDETGIHALGDDGFPIDEPAAELELDAAPEQLALPQHATVTVEPVAVSDTEAQR